MIFQYREIGESDWSNCSESWHNYCRNSPQHDTRAMNKETNPVKRLHNLCDALQEQQDESPYSADAWNDLEEENQALRNEASFKTARMQCLWKYLQELNKDTAIEPPAHFFEWFDNDGIPVPLNRAQD